MSFIGQVNRMKIKKKTVFLALNGRSKMAAVFIEKIVANKS